MVGIAPRRLGRSAKETVKAAGIPFVVASSFKAGEDTDWDQRESRNEGVRALLAQVGSLNAWLEVELAAELVIPPPADKVATLKALIEQGTVPDRD